MEQRRIAVDCGDIAVLEAGVGGRPVLLAHGFTGAKEDFADHLDSLAELGWWAVAPDLRGHGDSLRPDSVDAYSLEHFAADLDLLVHALGWNRFVLLGHSMGGMVAQVYALAHEDRLDGLVLMDTAGGPLGFIDEDLAVMGAAIALEEGMAALKQIVDVMVEAGPLTNEAFERVCAERPGHREFSDEKFVTASPAMYAAMLPAFPLMADRLGSLGGLSVPTLVLHGDLDHEFIELSTALAKAIPSATLVELAGGGHSPQFEAPEAWFGAISEFLRGLPTVS